jgi:uncharacterized protein (TIGR02444 family)
MNTHNPLWEFALKFYAQPGIEKQLLELQDSEGLSVNLLIYSIWLASEQRRLLSLPEQDGVINDWHMHVVKPIREARYHLSAKRQLSETVERYLQHSYEQLLKTELTMEQVELSLLFDARLRLSEKTTGMKENDVLIKNNLSFYFKNINLEPNNKTGDKSYTVKCESLVTKTLEVLSSAQWRNH